MPLPLQSAAGRSDMVETNQPGLYQQVKRVCYSPPIIIFDDEGIGF
jgi:hypothetical protein